MSKRIFTIMTILRCFKMSPLLLVLTILTLQCLVTGFTNKASDFELMENDSRYISHQDLMTTAKRFVHSQTTSYSQMLFDVARKQVIVGARDTLFRMSFDLDLLERSIWEASPEQISMCQAKGQSEHLCRNYVRVLQSYGENILYACGTYAFNPNCSWRQMENLTVIAYDSGVGKCPFSPKSNITSLMTTKGEMFVGITTDFSGSDTAILRTDIKRGLSGMSKIIRTKQYNSHWLNNPQFVGSFEAGNFVYFLFREAAVEFMRNGKVIYSRIARVCKNDVGGDTILRENWTSFLKARLNCSLPGEYPFYFDEIQGMTYSADEDVLYATFNTPENSIHGAAICAYNLTSIDEAFAGPFRHQEHIDSDWRSVNSPYRSQFQCESSPQGTRYKRLLDSSRYQLMDKAVQPITEQPLYHSKLERFQHVALDVVHTKTESIHVLFVSTINNVIKKLSVKYGSNAGEVQSCLVEMWQADEIGSTHILHMEYLKMTDSLYVGTDHALTSIPAQHCSRHVSLESCINAMDPYCGWSELIEHCVAQDVSTDMNKYWHQADDFKCPILTAPIDGAWSTWSDWYTCKKYGEGEGDCRCRSRECNNPRPQNGGHECDGITTEVMNCTVHGGWTEWSAWSACSQTCGIAVKTRRRTCGNPKPKHGGRTCVGSDHEEMYCSHLPPCPVAKPPIIDGGWGPWGEWSECSAQCDGGYRIRRRECNDPLPQNGGQECPGCHIDYEVCNAHPCTEVKKLSAWTPWLTQHNESKNVGGVEGVHVERRFRYICRAFTAERSSLHISLAKEERRICTADGLCHRHSDGNALAYEGDDHSEWGPCSASCGGGIQHRIHEGRHQGRHSQTRACNTQPCEQTFDQLNEVPMMTHEWSCWSEWSPCSVSCGVGIKRRTRKCLGGNEKLCNGRSVEERTCEMTPCADFIGWGNWSEWTECSSDGIRVRHRKCLVSKPRDHECRGSEFEKTACVPNPCKCSQTASIGWISGFCFMLMFWIITIPAVWYAARWYSAPVDQTLQNNSTNPAYGVFPNQYSSLPTKDNYEPRTKVKRQSSFNMYSTTKPYHTTTLTRNNVNHNHTPKMLAKTYNDCETGTWKRFSNTLNNQRTNNDDEKF